ncbi:MAG: hypothetical protein NC922_03970 [Candidatus Omnitrophica bacterium]|nr:hypothetical protein [Candidatus Omnitrophota bacterium]
MKKWIAFVFLFSLNLFSGEIFTDIEQDEIKYWKGEKGQAIVPPKVSISYDCVVGKNSIKAEAIDKGAYQGISLNLSEPVDLKEYEGIVFYIKQGYYPKKNANCVFRINYKDWFIYTDFNSGDGEWTKIYIPFDTARWKGAGNREVQFEKAISFVWYPYSIMNEPGKFIMIDGLELKEKKESSNKIIIKEYKYLSQIPEKDVNCKLLIDEKLDKENQIVCPAYSENPDILFDLGGIYKIERIKIEAIAVPSHNISNVIIFSSFDGERWEQVENIINESSESQETYQIIEKINSEIVGKYIRLKFDRLRSDFPIYIGEISFYGKIASEEDMKKFVLKKYSLGPSIPELNKENYWMLKEKDLEVWIDKNTGVIGGIFKNGHKIVERFFNSYIIAERNIRYKSDGYKDKVIEIIDVKDNCVGFKVKNSEIPYVEIEKEYILKDDRLEQKLNFKNLIEKKYVIYNITEVVLSKEYRQNGVYESWGGGHKLERKFADEIIIDFPAEYVPCLSFENFKENQVLFYYRYKKDENYVPLSYSTGGLGCLEKYSVVFTSTGWRVGDSTFLMNKKEDIHSLETHLSILNGTILNAYDSYLNLPEVKKFRSEIKRPKWLKDIKCQGDFGWEGLWRSAKERILQRYLSLLREGFIVFPALYDLNFTWGELPVEGEIRNLFGGVQKAEELKKEIEKLKEIGKGRIKIGIYTWLWSDNPYSKPFREHPEWYITKSESGTDLNFFTGVLENYYRMASNEDSRKEMFVRIYKMINYYNLDIWYLDGGGAFEIIDWENMRLDDHSGWHKLYLDLRNALQKDDPNKIVFFNHPENPLCDLGYYESFGGILQKNWRPGANWIWKFKLFQYKDPLHYPCFIYWTPSTEGYFEDYIVGAGVIPCFNSRIISPKDVAYVSAGWEIRPLEIAEANLKPNWRFDKNTNIEGYTFKKNSCGVIFLKSHYEKPIEAKIEVDLEPLGIIDKNKKVYSWLFRINNAKNWNGRFGEIELEDIYKNTGWIFDRVITPVFLSNDFWKERLEKNIKLNPEEGTLWIITQSPVFIYSIDNLPTQLWLPEIRNVKVEGEMDENQIKIKVKSDRGKVEIGCLLPDNMNVKNVYIGKEKIIPKLNIIENIRFIVFPVERGEWNIICELEKEKQEILSLPEISYTNPIPGTNMIIKIKFTPEWMDKTFVLQFEKENKIYYVENCFVDKLNFEKSIYIPQQIEKGIYNLIISDTTGKIKKTVNIEFPEGKSKIYLPPTLLPLSTEFGIKEVNIRKGNIEIYSYGWEFSKGAGGYKVDPDKLIITIYSLPMYESHWNLIAAGFEMKVERYLKIKIKGNFQFFNRYQVYYKKHSPRWSDPNYFIGFMLDFHTKDGYVKRSAVGLGIIKKERYSYAPTIYGCKKNPDEYFSLSDFVIRDDIEEEIMWIDLKQLGAPENWDGKIWLSPLMQIICPDRKLSIEILATSTTIQKEKIKEGIILGEKIEGRKNFKVPKVKDGIVIDGKLDEFDWKNALKFDDFSLLYFPMIKANQKTEAYLLYDNRHLYIGFLCEEKDKEILNIENSKPWSNDGIEFLLELYKEDGFFHGIIDAGGRYYQEIKKNGKKDQIIFSLFNFAVNKEKDFFIIEIKIPFNIINIENPEGKKIGFNLMRNRLFKGDIQYITLVPGNSYFVKDRYFLEF